MTTKTTISSGELQAITGMSRQRIARYVSIGAIEKAGHGEYPWPDVLQSLVRHLSEVAAGRGGEEASADLTHERALLAREQRRGHEIKNATLQGELVEASAVERRWASILSGVRARMLGLPSDLAQLLPHLTRHDTETIDRALRDALSEAADDFSGDA